MWLSDNTKVRFKNILLDIFDMFSFFVFVLGIVLFIRFFVANPYTVIWASMAPTFHERDFIIVDKITKRLDILGRWDVIVFVPEWKNTPYIKRIIWLPGETVKIKDWSVFICDILWENCKELVEPYLSEDVQTKTRCWKTEFQIEDGYFVLWDNRGFSTDSLCCFGLGCYDGANYEVQNKDIIGRVLFRAFPNFDTKFYD
jgi:signal peptidase I